MKTTVSIPLVVVIAALSTAATGVAQEGPPTAAVARQSAPPMPAPLRDALPALQRQSSWVQRSRYEGARPARRDRGVYPVGNGHVFTHLGLGERGNTALGITGPSYQTDAGRAPDGHFGGATLDLIAGGAPVALTEQVVRRVRGANFVLSEDRAATGLALRTLTFAPPDARYIVRVVEVANGSSAAVAGLQLVLRLDGQVAGGEGDIVRETYASRRRPATAFFRLPGATREGASLRLALPDLAAGKSWTGVTTIETHSGRHEVPPEQAAPADVAAATAAARATLAWWQAKLARTAEFDTDHIKLRDLIEDWKVMVLAQRCARSGVVSPMVDRRGLFVREMNGPMLLFLRFNMWDEARDYLRYVFQATRLLDGVPDGAPLDLDFDGIGDKAVAWSKIAMPAAELPAWIILQHFWYWRVTQDTALIRDHRSLLEACLKRQRRGKDYLMPFQGGEPYLRDTLGSLYPARVGDGSDFIADDPALGRRSFSFSSSVLFLIGMQAFGELEDGVDRLNNPARWAEGTPEQRPGRRYVELTFPVMQGIEKRYWLEHMKLFAPALSAVNEQAHQAPVANASLMPLWVGWTFPTGEKSAENLRNSLQRLWQRDRRLGSTATVGHATGDLQGMLLMALAERDGKARLDVLDAMLTMAEPAGEWAALYDPEGRPTHAGDDPTRVDRCQPGPSGVNIDAIYFALTGIRFACVPNWDNTDIRMKLRLPRGATYVTYKDIKKDARHLHLFFRETREPLSKAEREQNDKQPPEKRRKPNEAHRRLRFRVQQLSANPPRGYFDAAINACGTMFVRYLWKEQEIAEAEFWAEDAEVFLPAGPTMPRSGPQPLARAGDAKLLVLTCRPATAEMLGSTPATIVDTGLPWRVAELRALLVDGGGKRVHDELYLDWGHDSPGPATYRTAAFWQGAELAAALTAFRGAGGVILRPQLITRYEIATGDGWRTVEAPGGRLELTGPARVRARLAAPRAGEAVLRIGTSGAATVSWNGSEVYRHDGDRVAMPDLDAELVKVTAGDNTLEVELRGAGKAVLFSRLSDSRGLPLR